MRETDDDLHRLQSLLDASHGRSGEHLRGIINDDRTLTARQVCALMSGMKVLSLATVTRSGEPRISAVDGHFLHGTWTFSTAGDAVKAGHLRSRPAVSVAHIDNEDLALFAHGTAEELPRGHPDLAEIDAHWTAHYESSPLSWGDDIRMYRLQTTWMVGYAFQRDRLLADRGIAPDPD